MIESTLAAADDQTVTSHAITDDSDKVTSSAAKAKTGKLERIARLLNKFS